MRRLGKLTLAHLEKFKACFAQRHLFEQTFPKGFIPSEKNFRRAASVGLDIAWALNRITSTSISDKIYHNVEYRRWGPQKTWLYESYSHSVAQVWWELIQYQAHVV